MKDIEKQDEKLLISELIKLERYEVAYIGNYKINVHGIIIDLSACNFDLLSIGYKIFTEIVDKVKDLETLKDILSK